MPLDQLNDDTLIYMISLFSIPEILALRQTCKRILELCGLRAVWHNACLHNVLLQGFPFPKPLFESSAASQLRGATCNSYRIGNKWLSASNMNPRAILSSDIYSSASVSDVKFMYRNGQRCILTVSKGIWSVITAWEIENDCLRRIANWGPKGALFQGFAVNESPIGSVTLAISILQDEWQRIELLSLDRLRGTFFHGIGSIGTKFKPITLKQDILAYSDDLADTVVWDLTSGNRAVLRHVNTSSGLKNSCIRVVFTHESILVVRARSIHLFPMPALGGLNKEGPIPVYAPLAGDSMGWIDGISISTSPGEHGSSSTESPPDISILFREASDDPWAINTLKLKLYTLPYNPAFTCQTATKDGLEERTVHPYVFPLFLSSQVASRRGALRCTDLVLGPQGTAIWIQPHDRTASGLVADNLAHVSSEANECLMAAVFPGPLLRPGAHAEDKHILTNPHNNWTCLDYDEETGRIALGSSFGRVIMLEL